MIYDRNTSVQPVIWARMVSAEDQTWISPVSHMHAFFPGTQYGLTKFLEWINEHLEREETIASCM